MTQPYTGLHVSILSGVAHVTIDNPPVNVLTVQLMTELTHLLKSLEEDA